MSIHIMSLVWERAPYEGGTLLVLLALADWANEEGVTWPSLAQLAGKSRMKIRNARYILRTLETDGMLTREQTGSGRTTTVYRINMARLAQMPAAWKRPHAQSDGLVRVQNDPEDEFVPRQILHEAPHCLPGGHPIAPLPGNDCLPGGHPIAALGGTPLPPTHHRSVIDPSGDPPTPAELGLDGSAYRGGEGTKSGTPRALGANPRERGINPRELETNPRAVATQTAKAARAACGLCDVRGQVELRRADDTVVMLRCPHDRAKLSAAMSAHAYTWPGAPPGATQGGPAP